VAALPCLFLLSACWEMLVPVEVGLLYPKYSARLKPNGKKWVNAGGGSPAVSYGGRNRGVIPALELD